jgi:hypothetical protein
VLPPVPALDGAVPPVLRPGPPAAGGRPLERPPLGSGGGGVVGPWLLEPPPAAEPSAGGVALVPLLPLLPAASSLLRSRTRPPQAVTRTSAAWQSGRTIFITVL